jgi:hypothetical protein
MKCLEAEHHICDYAADGEQAIEKVEKRMGSNEHSKGVERPYNVVLMDYVVSFYVYICIDV